MDSLEIKFGRLDSKVNDFINDKDQGAMTGNTPQKPPYNPLTDTEVTIIAIGVPYRADETMNDLGVQVAELIKYLGEEVSANVSVVTFCRLVSRKQNPGLVKISFSNLDQKKMVLHAKSNPKKSILFPHVHLHDSQIHTERLIQIKFDLIYATVAK